MVKRVRYLWLWSIWQHGNVLTARHQLEGSTRNGNLDRLAQCSIIDKASGRNPRRYDHWTLNEARDWFISNFIRLGWTVPVCIPFPSLWKSQQWFSLLRPQVPKHLEDLSGFSKPAFLSWLLTMSFIVEKYHDLPYIICTPNATKRCATATQQHR